MQYIELIQLNNFEDKPVMAYLQVSQLGIHGEDSWWQLFDLVTVQVPGVKRNTV